MTKSQHTYFKDEFGSWNCEWSFALDGYLQTYWDYSTGKIKVIAVFKIKKS